MSDGKKKQEIAEYINELVLGVIEVISYDDRAALWHAKERARLQTMGIIRPFADGQIASIAAINSLILVTRNERDFQHYEGLCIENGYVEP